MTIQFLSKLLEIKTVSKLSKNISDYNVVVETHVEQLAVNVAENCKQDIYRKRRYYLVKIAFLLKLSY